MGHSLALTACILLIITAFVFGLSAMFHMVRMTLNRKPGVPYFPGSFQTPYNIIFHPEQLTERGLQSRRRVVYGVLGMLIAGGVAALIGAVTGVMH